MVWVFTVVKKYIVNGPFEELKMLVQEHLESLDKKFSKKIFQSEKAYPNNVLPQRFLECTENTFSDIAAVKSRVLRSSFFKFKRPHLNTFNIARVLVLSTCLNIGPYSKRLICGIPKNPPNKMYSTYDYFESTSFGPESITDNVLSASTFLNHTPLYNQTSLCEKGFRSSKMLGIVVKVVYAIGIFGNAAAIVALRRGERRVRNRKHLLLLTTLAANDLVALMGMMGAMLVSEWVEGASSTRWYCGARVVLRVFGIGSVCIAVTMALERYVALTRPFLYQKQVTYYVIRMALLLSWFWAAALTCAPVLGLGLYYDETNQCCPRYRNATSGLDFAYAVFYVFFGTLLCAVLVYCNLAVIRALYAITAPRGGGPPAVRRVSRSSCRARSTTPHHNAATAEEVAFSRLMATLSVLFMICWLPQMVTSALYLTLGPSARPRLRPLSAVSDLLMLLNYVLDPVLYVLMRQRRNFSPSSLCRSIAHCFKRNHKTSTESMKTSCCVQDTLVLSDSSGAELRPLQQLQPLTTYH